MKVEQRQHLSELRGLAGPGRQNARGEPLSLTGNLIDTFVVDPRLTHHHRARGRHDLTRIVIPIADYQPVTVLINLARMGFDERGDLNKKSRREHLPCTITDDLIKQRDTGRGSTFIVGIVVLLDYLEHGRTFPTSASTPAMISLTGLQIILGKVRHSHANSPRTIHRCLT